MQIGRTFPLETDKLKLAPRYRSQSHSLTGHFKLTVHALPFRNFRFEMDASGDRDTCCLHPRVNKQLIILRGRRYVNNLFVVYFKDKLI